MLEVKNVTKSFGTLVAVNNLSFTIKPGEIFALLGTNGAGKTTTFRMITGLLVPNEGEILWDNNVIGYNVSDKIGFLVEERALLTKMKVSELVHYYARLKSMKPDLIEERLIYWLDRLHISDYKDKKIKELSKGNQQKIQFITSIINEPELLILDEPFSGLDPLNMELFIEIIREFQKKGTCIIFSTHRIEHVELFCENLVVLQEGKTVLSGNIDKIKDDFMRKTISIKADVNIDDLKAIEGVVYVKQNLNEYVVSVANLSYVGNVFKYVSSCSNVNKFVVDKPSLSEIFIEKVGMEYNG